MQEETETVILGVFIAVLLIVSVVWALACLWLFFK
jgi:hypothetical protein